MARQRSAVTMPANQPAQGILAPDVLLGKSVVDLDVPDLMRAVVDFVNWLLGEARLNFPEIGDLARRTYLTDQYITQVDNGGHPQYVHNVVLENKTYGILDETLELIQATLAQCSEPGYVRVFRDFNELLNA